MEHVFRSTTRVARPLDEVFEFFSNAANLEAITPPELRFRILTPSPIAMREGTRIDYELRLMGVRFKWQTLITVWDPPHRFVDEQLSGPYRQWIHTHTFASDGAGTLIEDEVRWRLPMFPFGQVAHPLVSRQIRRIFEHREKTIRAMFS